MTRMTRSLFVAIGSIAAVMVMSMTAMASNVTSGMSRAVIYEQMLVDKMVNFERVYFVTDIKAADTVAHEAVAVERFSIKHLRRTPWSGKTVEKTSINQFFDVSVAWPAKRDRWRTRTL